MKKLVIITLCLSQILFAQLNENEIVVTIEVTPVDATISVDGISVKNETQTKLLIGNHTLKVEKTGYTPYNKEIKVSSSSTFFKVNLSTDDPVAVIIGSKPTGAEISLDGVIKDKTEKAMFLYPGSYDLRITQSGYLPLSDRFTVSQDESKNIFNYNLTKNAGTLRLEVNPADAILKINKKVVARQNFYELAPGTYQIEVEAETYNSYKGKVEISLGETKTERITLKQRTGKLQFSINPHQATCILSQKGIGKYSWNGLRILDSVAEGTYDLNAKANGYKKYNVKVIIKENQTTTLDIQMTAGSDPPEGFAFVAGKNFTIDGYKWSSYYISKYEVTCELWDSIMGDSRSISNGSKKPVGSITWKQMIVFCNKLSEIEGLQKAYSGTWDNIVCDFTSSGYRLPTDAEWEYAAKGGNKSKGYKYSGGNDLGKVSWYRKNSKGKIHDVGTKQPNELGIYDMSGNLWECFWDSGSFSTHNGGYYNSNESYCRPEGRWFYDLSFGSTDIGFRLARTK